MNRFPIREIFCNCASRVLFIFFVDLRHKGPARTVRANGCGQGVIIGLCIVANNFNTLFNHPVGG